MGWYLGEALTNAQEKELNAIFNEYHWAVRYGEPVIEEVGYETQNISVQCAAYGFTIASVFYCLQAARNGLTTALVGGWRDRRNLAGMTGGGLGFMDWSAPTNVGGLPSVITENVNGRLPFYVVKRNRAIISAGSDQFYLEPKYAQAIMLELLDPLHNGGYTIPVYQTNGVHAVNKTGTAITSITTTDGRTVTASQWHDGSYEIDLARAAGCSYTLGREAAGSGTDSSNGIDGSPNILTGVDPFNTPGVPGSGFLPNIQAGISAFTPALNTLPAAGTADAVAVQSNNFRLAMANSTVHANNYITTPPPGFNIADFELFLRWLSANSGTVTQLSHVFATNSVGSDKYDVNNKGGTISSDWIGAGWSYPTDTYANREVSWKATWNRILGLIYLLQNGNALDSRVSAAIQTNSRTWGITSDHFFSPHENDAIGDSPQMYIREAARLVSDNILIGADMTKTDGTAPRISTKTIGTSSYSLDSHAFRMIAKETSAGVWAAGSEGGLSISAGGVDVTTPIPLEVVVPKAAECTNLSVSFGGSYNHMAMCGMRLEMTTWQIGQSMGQAAAQAITDGSTIQAVNYTTVRTSLLANAFALTGEVAPVLPQVN